MKGIFKNVIIFIACLIPAYGFSQSTARNYVATWTATAPISDTGLIKTKPLSDVKLSVQYFDGLGRPIQTVSKQGSLKTSTGASADLVTFRMYDGLDRDSVLFLPYAATTADASYKSDALTAQPAFYNSADSPDSGQDETGSNAHTLAVYEPSPLDRAIENFAPGNSWIGTESQPAEAARRSVKQKYWINTAKDSVRIWNCTYPAQGSWGSYSSPSSPFYAAGALYKNVTTDEAGHQVIEFKDKEGQVVLKKVQYTAAADSATDNTTAYAGWLCTYYIYDDLNNLRCVVQPEGVKWLAANSWNLNNAVLLAEQTFRYEYDGRNRMIMKQAPGAGAVYMVYDKRDRLVMTQDAGLRARNSWIVTRYDNLNRADTTWLDSMPSAAFNTLLTAAAATSPYPATLPTSANLLTATHYDDYTGITFPSGVSGSYKGTWSSYYLPASTTSFPYPVTPSAITATSVPVNTKSLVTWTQARALNSSPAVFITTVNFYDDKGRLIQTQSNNITGGAEVNTIQYSWAGQPLITIRWQSKSGTRPDTSITVIKMTYDDLNRPVKTEMKQSNSRVNAGTMPAAYTTVSTMAYDALGQLKTKTLGNQRASATTYTATPLETEAFEYNIRGWLLGVNRAYTRDKNSTDSTAAMAQTQGGELFTEGDDATVSYPNTPYFGFDLGYDKTNNGLINNQTYSHAQYTGNIAGMVWKNAGDSKVRKYDFSYDAVNRLGTADFNQYTHTTFNKTANVDYSVSGLSYDGNGNIKTMNQYGLKSNGSSSIIDQLTYTYQTNSNKLERVTDAAVIDSAEHLGDFQDGNKSGDDYAYDGNGNLIQDLNKKITQIQYNYLNLPSVIRVNGKGSIYYTYDAAGNKLKKVTVDSTVLPAKITTTLYIGSSVYVNDTLQFFGTAEGRVRPKADSSRFVYDYFLKDHLGNVRMVITDDYNVASPVIEATNYYPFGLTMAGISSKALNNVPENKYKFTGQLFDDDLGWNTYQMKFRTMDPQIGRFLQVDPLASKYVHNSTYAYAENDVIRAIDIEGLEKYIVTMRAFIPQKTVGNPNPFSSNKTFAGDNRMQYQANATSYRTEQKVNADFDNKSLSVLNNTASGSTGYNKDSKVNETSTPGSAGKVRGNVDDFENAVGKPQSAVIDFETNASNKLVAGAPAINADINLTITPNKDGSFNYSVKGSTDGFPAYELWVTDDKGNSYLILNSTPTESGKTPVALFPPEDQKYNNTGNSKDVKKPPVVNFPDTQNSPQVN